MTSQEIDNESLKAAEGMVKLIVRQAGLVLSNTERQLIITQAQHLYLCGIEDGMRLSKLIMKGGETDAKSQ